MGYSEVIIMEPVKIEIEIDECDFQHTLGRPPASQKHLDIFAEAIQFAVKHHLRSIYYSENAEEE